MAKRPNNTGSLFQRGNVWWIAYFRGEQRFQESSKSRDKADARRLLAKRLGEIATGTFTGPVVERTTLADLCDLVLEDYRYKKLRDAQMVEWRINAHFRAIGSTLAHRFGTSQVKRYVEERRSAGAADTTINRELAIVRRGFTLALQAEPPLVARAPHIPKLAEDNARQGFIEDAQYRTLLNAMPDHLKCLLVCGFHLGMRIGELRKLRWSQVDIKAQEIRLEKRQTKAKAARTVPIYGDMAVWLEFQWEANKPYGSPLVFHKAGKPISSHITGWRESCITAGMGDLLFHDLRRSAVRNMERAGIPRNVAMAISGHKTESIFRRYDIVAARDLQRAGKKLDAYMQAQRETTVATVVATPTPKHVN